MNSFNTLVRWIVVSSADSSQVSLTIKGVLVGLVPYAIAMFGLTHVAVGPDQLNAIIDGLCTVISTVGTAISAIAVFVGLVRKLWITIRVHQQTVNPAPTSSNTTSAQ